MPDDWTVLAAADQVPAFVDAAVALHDPLLERLTSAGRAFFVDYWLGVFNTSHAWLLTDANGPVALATVPRMAGMHDMRWWNRTFAWRPDVLGSLVLPARIDLGRSLTVPVGACEPAAEPATKCPLKGRSQRVLQIGYVGPTAHDAPAGTPPAWRFRPATEADLTDVQDLFTRAHEGTSGEEHRDSINEELRLIGRHGAGWCWLATGPDAERILAAVSYGAMTVPLAGVPAALVSDLAVAMEARGSGLAQALQRHAQRCLARQGVGWVFGHIDPDNGPSCGQAERTGREAWYRTVLFEPAL